MQNNNKQYFIRNFHYGDLPEYYKIFREKEKIEGESAPSLELLKKRLQRPRFEPENDLFLAIHGERLAGYMELTREPDIKRVILEGMVYHNYRRNGIGSLLLEACIKRARDLGLDTIHVGILNKNLAGKKFLQHHGFTCIRRHLEMKTRLHRKIPGLKNNRNPCSLSRLEMRHLKEGEEDFLAELQNHCFEDTWGYQPNTGEDIRFKMDISGSTPEDVLVGFAREEAAGYCWTATSGPETSGNSRILMLGVKPAFRGKGIAGELLATSLNTLQKELKAREVELTADRDNFPALRLYRSFGFRKCKETWWYELKLP